MEGLKKTLAYYSNFNRKVTRKEHVFTLIALLIYILINIFLIAELEEPINLIFILTFIHAYWMLFANYASRLRDIGNSPWLLLFIFIPALNLILFFYMLFAPSNWVNKEKKD